MRSIGIDFILVMALAHIMATPSICYDRGLARTLEQMGERQDYHGTERQSTI